LKRQEDGDVDSPDDGSGEDDASTSTLDADSEAPPVDSNGKEINDGLPEQPTAMKPDADEIETDAQLLEPSMPTTPMS